VIHASVLDVWHRYSEPLEGRVECMYLDVRGLVTTGVGNLIDSPDAALALPWRTDDWAMADPGDVVSEWARVKGMPYGRSYPWTYYRDRTRLRLTDDAIDALVVRVLHAMACELERQFTEWPTWPADAQLGALSRAWAAGTCLDGWPLHRNACERRAWLVAGEESVLVEDGNPGVVPRNHRQRVAFRNAHVVDSRSDGALSRDTCYWPLELVA
jgi:hypothetical protein